MAVDHADEDDFGRATAALSASRNENGVTDRRASSEGIGNGTRDHEDEAHA